MRAPVWIVFLAACVLLVVLSAPCSAHPSQQPAQAAQVRLRFRREGQVDVDVDKQRGQKPRVTVNGERNVWKDGNRRVDVRGSADNRGSRGAGVSFKW